MNKYIVLLFIALSSPLKGQFGHEVVYPSLQGDALLEALIEDYKTSTVLSYSEARDTFFRNIDAVDNQLECVYSGYKITLDPELDPTTDAFAKNINTEHTYPRSKGALENTNAYSDMHHLFPTRVNVNSDRGSLIFDEVTDSQTDKWYLEDDVQTSIPSTNIDGYSELLTNVAFEPREQHKGDVARAYFYFYTMYKSQADNEAPNFFELQRETMCDWHFQDPVDEKEWNRNIKIAEYQDGKKNPFILDCRLARIYCGTIEGYCTTVSTSDESRKEITAVPNPTKDRLYFENTTTASQFEVVNVYGQRIKTGYLNSQGESHFVSVGDIDSGYYIIQLQDSKGNVIAVSKFIKL